MKERKMFSSKVNSLFYAGFMILLCAFFITTSASAQTEVQRFKISENGNITAKVVTEVNGEIVKVSIYRVNQPTHVYRTAIWAGVTTFHSGRNQVLEYQNDSKQVQIGNVSFIATQVSPLVRKVRPEVSSVLQQVVDDMRVLRAVRAFDSSAEVKFAELALVIATGEDSIYLGDAPQLLKVNEATKKARANAQAKLIKASSRLQGGTFEGCKSDCAAVRRNCASDPRVSDPTVCYTNENNCNLECHRIYKDEPAPVDPPQN